ncbi:MAG: phosphotransferase family protein [Alphaproteobacteria bacterium]|nr:phosphotransferase family protein [Alphaproteobacteria bacterium]
MASDYDDVLAGLHRLAGRLGWPEPRALQRLSGGASQETWAFVAGERALILRRAPRGVPVTTSTQGIGLVSEAAVIEAAGAAGAPAPAVASLLAEQDGLGPGYIMDRLEGETLARRIQRDAAFAEARDGFAQACGAAAAAIHATPLACLPTLPEADAAAQLDLYEAAYRGYGAGRPAFELGFAALRRRVPAPIPARLAHGDFRLGNLMVARHGLAAVLDWELAHRGDPAEDLGWICTPSWRFGAIDKPVGGIAEVGPMLEAYWAAGGDRRVTAERVRFWTLFGSLKWGVMCLTMAKLFESGVDPSVERAAIGRRASETELDVLLMLKGLL